jgi:hypothetical protein
MTSWDSVRKRAFRQPQQHEQISLVMLAIFVGVLAPQLIKGLQIAFQRWGCQTRRFSSGSRRSACFLIFSLKRDRELTILSVAEDTRLARHLELIVNERWSLVSRPCPGFLLVLPLKMVDNSTSSLQTQFGPVFGDEAVQTGHLILK